MKKITWEFLHNNANRLEVIAQMMRGAAYKLISAKKVYLAECERQNWTNLRSCFVLSPGRSGTLLLTKVLELSYEAYPMHVPRPELCRPSLRAYEQMKNHPEIFREVLKSAREDYVLNAVRTDRVYVETNNRITFFAPIIRDVFPNSVFIHLVRHPGDFVRSGVRRGWYSGYNEADVGRIVPTTCELLERWKDWSPIERIGWLWNETNQFIEDFKDHVSPQHVLLVKAEDLFRDIEISRQIYRFLGIDDFQSKRVARLLRRPVNIQKKGGFPPYKEWRENDKALLKRFASLASKYGYTL